MQSCTGEPADGASIDTSTLGPQTLTVTAVDNAGNTATKEIHYTVVPAQDSATLVKDIAPGSGDSSPANLTKVGGTVFFTLADADHGIELWKSDGTADGTTIVKDIYPGAGSSDPSYLTNVDGTLYFSATDADHGTELWKSDGTADGTRLVSDIYPGSTSNWYGTQLNSSSPFNLTAVGDELYFTAGDADHGQELWKSDGTADGTVLVADVQPGGGSSGQRSLTDVGGELYFNAYGDGHGYELWKSDGTALGTTLVKDIYPGTTYDWYTGQQDQNSGYPSNLTDVGGTLYFAATDANGTELWKSDGTALGTTLVKDIYLGTSPDWYSGQPVGNSGNPSNLTNVGGTLYFTATDGSGTELWKSDGTEAGTTAVGSPGSFSNASNLTEAGGTLYFSATDPSHGQELWKSDGTADGTTLVKDINPAGSSNPQALTNLGGELYFSATDPEHGRELWRSDGTADGTVLVRDIHPGWKGSSPSSLTNVGSALYFDATDSAHGQELWKTTIGGSADPSPAALDFGDSPIGASGTAQQVSFKNNGPGRTEFAGHTFGGANPGDFSVSDDNCSGTTLEVGDECTLEVEATVHAAGARSATLTVAGSTGGPYRVALTANGVDLTAPVVRSVTPEDGGVLSQGVQVKAEYSCDDGPGGSGVKSCTGDPADGASIDTSTLGPQTVTVSTVDNAGNSATREIHYTVVPAQDSAGLVKDIAPGSGASNPSNLTKVGGTVYFLATDTNGTELWKSDGTTAGTTTVGTPGSFSYPQDPTNFGGTLYFSAYDPSHGQELWKSDGTADGTKLVSDVNPGSVSDYYGTRPNSSSPSNLTAVGGELYFTATDADHGTELWKSDGTDDGTRFVKDVYPGSNGSYASNLTDVGGELYFTATDADHGQELWKSDGTDDGTTLVEDIYPGGYGSNPSNLTNVGGTLYFSAYDADHGQELWKSDGTEAGTTTLGSPGSLSYPSSLTNVNGTLYFSAYDGDGYELWKSDGTEAGTTTVGSPGSFSYPSSLAKVGRTLYFSASDPEHGQELWKSDGTDDGTTLVKDIDPGDGSSGPFSLTNVSGTLYFSASDPDHGTELWRSDGTSAGTALVRDIYPGPGGSSAQNLTSVRGTLFFSATDPVHGQELWKTTIGGTADPSPDALDFGDGSIGAASAAQQVSFKNNGPGRTEFAGITFGGANPGDFSVSNDNCSGTTLEVGDTCTAEVKATPHGRGARSATLLVAGSTGGTYSVALTANGVDLTAPTIHFDTPTNGVPLVQGTPVKASYSCADEIGGSGVKSCTGTTANGSTLDTSTLGAHRLSVSTEDNAGNKASKTVTYVVVGTPGAISQVSALGSQPSSLTDAGGTLFFTTYDPSSGSALWTSDGTPAGTTMLASGLTYVTSLTSVGNTLYFLGYDSSYNPELWRSDGTVAGTTKVGDSSLLSYPGNLTNVGGSLYFSAYDSSLAHYGLWTSDGTAAGTKMVYTAPGVYPVSLTNVGGTLYFSSNGSSLWKSDGTAAGTKAVGPSVVNVSNLTNVGGTLYFAANDYNHGLELWKSDGTDDGTKLVKDVYPGSTCYSDPYDCYYGYDTYPNSSSPSNLTNVGGTLYFTATDANGTELWKSDGTEAGTTTVGSPGSFSNAQNLTEAGGTLYFSATDSSHGTELWKSDGTDDGTTLVKDINPGGDSNPQNLTNVGGSLYFSATDPGGTSLWKSDGTADGTTVVQEGTSPSNLKAVGASLFFTDSSANLWTITQRVAPSPLLYDYGSHPIDSTSSAKTFTIRNNDAGPLSISGFTPGGDDPGDFAVSAETCTDASIPAGGTCTVDVEFTPQGVGERSAIFAVEGDSDASTISVVGTGLDVVKPTVSITTPVDQASYNHGSTVAADYSCADETHGSGLDTCVGSVADGSNIDTSSYGSHTFTVTAQDKAGNQTTKTVSYTVPDDLAPVTGDDVSPDWSTSEQPVTLTATDTGGSGLDKTYYTTDGTTPTTGSSVYSASTKPTLANGQSIKYFSTDAAGNAEPVKTSKAAKVDGTAPSTGDDVGGAWQTSAISVTLTATDGVAGVDKTYYTTDGTTPTTGSSVYSASSKPTLANGQSIKYFSVDKAGNAEVTKESLGAKVDGTAPATTDDVPTKSRTNPVTVTLSATDTDSGVAHTYYTAGADPAAPAQTPADLYDPAHKPVLQDGEKIRYFSVDQAGNAEPDHTSSAAKVDSSQPGLAGTIGGPGTGDGQFEGPGGTAIAGGLLYVVDSQNGRVEVFDPATGDFVRSFSAPSGGGGAPQLAGIAIANGLAYVVDAVNHQVDVFNAATGAFLESIGASDLGDPAGIAFSDGKLYVTDPSTDEVKVFDASTGALLDTIGGPGSGAGQLDNPVGITVVDGLIYIADPGNHRIDVFDAATGNFVEAIGAGVLPGGGSVCTAVTGCQSGDSGSGAGAIDPIGIAVVDGEIFVADASNQRVDVFDAATGSFERALGAGVNPDGSDVCTAGSGCQGGTDSSDPGALTSPYSLVVADGILYVSDAGSNRVVEFTVPDANAPTTTDDVSGDWSKTAQPVTLDATDTGGSGIAHTYFTTDGSDPTTSSDEYDSSDKPKLANGESIKYFSVDAAGNAEPVETSPAAKVDTSKPSTANNVDSNWHGGPVSVTLTPDDGSGSGIAHTYYTTDGTTPTSASAQYPQTTPTLGNGESIKFFSVDAVGNAETVKSAGPAKVDTTAPTTSDDVASGWTQSAQAVHLSADDGGQSGSAHTYYTKGTSPADPTQVPAELYDAASPPTLSNGEKIKYFLIDAVGNAETVQTSKVAKVDPDAPTTTDNVPSKARSNPVTVTLTADDGSGSGVAHTYYTTGATPAAPQAISADLYDPAHKPVLEDGQKIRYFSIDAVGNAEVAHSSAAAIVDSSSPAYAATIGGPGSGDGQFAAPAGEAIADGLLYVVDSDNGRVEVFDAATGEFVRSFGAPGTGDGELSGPGGIAIDSGLVYVVDTGNHRIVVFDASTGDFVREFGDSDLDSPSGIAISGGKVYVTDPGSDTVEVFDAATGAHDSSFGGPGAGAGQLSDPEGITVVDGVIYVADRGNHRIDVFDASSEDFVEAFGAGVLPGGGSVCTALTGCQAGSAGTGAGAIDPVGIVVYGGEIFVTDPSNGRIDVFDAATGAFERALGAGVNPDGSDVCTAASGCQPGTGSDDAGALGSPYGIVLYNGQLYITDGASNQVVIYDAPDGNAPKTTDNVDSNWHGAPVTVALAALDTGGSGLAHTYFTTDGTTPTASSDEYSSADKPKLQNGESIRYFSVDQAGNDEPVHTSPAAKVDTSKPSTGNNVDSNWHGGPVSVTLTPDDGSGSGIAHTYYTTDGTTPTSASAQYPQTTPTLSNGESVKFFSVDAVGNAETVKSAGPAKVDTTAPTTSDDYDGSLTGGPQTVHLSASDGAGSGVAHTYFTKGASPADPTQTPADLYNPAHPPVIADGEQVKYFSVDTVGNAETVKSSAADKSDTSAPTTTDDVSSAWTKTAKPAHLSASDGTGSGVAHTYYTVGATPAQPTATSADLYNPQSPPALQDGQRIRYFSVDKLGNSETAHTSPAAHVDGTAPKTTDDVPSADQLGPVTVALTATDSGSGLDKTYYTTGADPATPTTSSSVYDIANRPVLHDGEKIRYFSVDKAGNAETPHSSSALKVIAPVTQTVGGVEHTAPILAAGSTDTVSGWVGEDGSFSVPVSCPATATADCEGTIELHATLADGTTVILGSVTYHLSPGQKLSVVVPLYPAAAELLSILGRHRLSVTAVAIGKDASGKKFEQQLGAFVVGVAPRKAARQVVQRSALKPSGKRWKLMTRGHIKPGKSMSAKQACRSGAVGMTVTQGTKQLLARTVSLTKGCTFKFTSKLKGTPKAGAPIKVKLTFLGSLSMRPKAAHRQLLIRR